MRCPICGREMVVRRDGLIKFYFCPKCDQDILKEGGWNKNGEKKESRNAL